MNILYNFQKYYYVTIYEKNLQVHLNNVVEKFIYFSNSTQIVKLVY